MITPKVGSIIKVERTGTEFAVVDIYEEVVWFNQDCYEDRTKKHFYNCFIWRFKNRNHPEVGPEYFYNKLHTVVEP